MGTNMAGRVWKWGSVKNGQKKHISITDERERLENDRAAKWLAKVDKPKNQNKRVFKK